MRKSLHFKSNGTFKIVQFTDTEFCEPDEEELQMKAMMKRILEKEQPDLVIYTGDVIASNKSPNPIQAFKDAVSVPKRCKLHGRPYSAIMIPKLLK